MSEDKNQNNKKRTVSYKKGIWFTIIGSVLITVISIIYYFKTCISEAAIMKNIILSLLFLGGVILLATGIGEILKTHGTNKRLACLDYDFDLEKELTTYSLIGIKKGKCKNGAEHYGKYSEWKEHIEVEYENQGRQDDFYRYLIRETRYSQLEVELIIALLIPVEIAIIELTKDLSNEGNLIVPLVSSVFFIFVVIQYYNSAKNKVYFYKDLMEILFPQKENHNI